MVFVVALSSRLDSVSRPIDASPAPHLSPVVRQHRRRGEPTDTTPDDHDVGRTRRRRRPTPRAMSSFALVLIIHRRASVASQRSSSNPRARARRRARRHRSRRRRRRRDPSRRDDRVVVAGVVDDRAVTSRSIHSVHHPTIWFVHVMPTKITGCEKNNTPSSDVASRRDLERARRSRVIARARSPHTTPRDRVFARATPGVREGYFCPPRAVE